MSDGSAIFTLTSRLHAYRTLAGSRRGHCARWWMATTLLGLWFISGPSWSGKYARDMIHEVHQPLPYKWTKFVEVQGQPESIPAEWVSTAEGRFAHAIKIPNPLPKDSGYKWRMSSKEYFLHLCEKEAGEFTYRRAESVDGVLFMRPPDRPSDYDLMDRYKL